MSEISPVPTRSLSLPTGAPAGEVSARLARPRGARWLYVMAHGAGAGMNHRFLEAMSGRLYQRKIATLRFQFPYVEAGRKRPDHQKILVQTIAAAIDWAARSVRLPLVAGGKSMGGRMTSLLCAGEDCPRAVLGLVFLGFPLHAAGKPSDQRAAHLRDVPVPMLFLQGTRDTLADLERIRGVTAALGERARMHVVDGADHSFGVLVRSGRNGEQVLDELADVIARWGAELLG